MTRYAVFLRGINVGGHNVVSMADLRRAFEALGFESVKTYIQSGNVFFETKRASRAQIAKQIGAALQDLVGSEVPLSLRTVSELEALAQSDPFGGAHIVPGDHLFVSFLPEPPRTVPPMPLWSSTRDVELLVVRGADVLSLGHAYRGHFGFPNAFIEKQFGMPATTRNWHTFLKMMG